MAGRYRYHYHDKTPQFINYGVDGTPNGLVYAGRGESCQKIIRENRECVGKKLDISSGGLSFEWMQEDKFLRAELCFNDITERNQ